MYSKIISEKVRSSECENRSYIEMAIPFLAGRPDRDNRINIDDIVNLIIACNTCGSLEEFFLLT